LVSRFSEATRAVIQPSMTPVKQLDKRDERTNRRTDGSFRLVCYFPLRFH
jgi:hypothetical protein